MANQFEFKIEGVRELKAKFRLLSVNVQKRILRKAAKKASEPILKDAQSLVPVRTGRLKKDLGILIKKAGPFAFLSRIGNSGRAFHAFLVEYGHKISGGGRVAAKPFLRPSFDMNVMKAIDIANSVFRNELIKKGRRS